MNHLHYFPFVLHNMLTITQLLAFLLLLHHAVAAMNDEVPQKDATQEYRIDVKPLGEGSFGKVFKAKRLNDDARNDTILSRNVAIKMFKAKWNEMPRNGSKSQQTWLDEVKVMQSMHGIESAVQYIEHFVNVNDGKFYLVMELAEHGSLHTLLREQRPFALEEIQAFGIVAYIV